MARKKVSSGSSEQQTDFLSRLDELAGGQTSLEVSELDATILWAVTVCLAEQGSSITLGVTQARDSWVLQLWDGKIPRKWYFRETRELNRHLAAIVRVAKGNKVAPELEHLLRDYGW